MLAANFTFVLRNKKKNTRKRLIKNAGYVVFALEHDGIITPRSGHMKPLRAVATVRFASAPSLGAAPYMNDPESFSGCREVARNVFALTVNGDTAFLGNGAH